MSDSDQLRIRHMLDAAKEVVSFTKGRERSDLVNDRMLFLSLMSLYQIIGEAASHVSDELRREHPAIEWREASSMRNRLSHGYFDVDYNVMWDTAVENIPTLIAQLTPLITQFRLEL